MVSYPAFAFPPVAERALWAKNPPSPLLEADEEASTAPMILVFLVSYPLFPRRPFLTPIVQKHFL